MSRVSRIVGVLGGMGPEATIDFMSKVVALTDADRDQGHIRMIIDHNPQVPNRQDAILHGGEDPGPVLATMAAGLEAAGADFLVIPCNTAYVFEDAIVAATGIPLVSIITESIESAKRSAPLASRIGILATDGCIRAGVYQAGLDAAGLTPVLPDEDEIDELMTLTSAIKAREYDAQTSKAMAGLAAALTSRGADAIIAGCTEVPLVLRAGMIDVPLVSSTDALAAKTVMLATGVEPLPKR